MKELFQTYSHSQRALFAECQRKYSYKYVEGLEDAAGLVASYSSACVHPLMQAIHSSVGMDHVTLAAELYKEWEEGKEFLELLKYPQCSLSTLQKIVKQYKPMVEEDRVQGWTCEGVERSIVLPAHAEDRALRYTAKVDVLETLGALKRPVEFKFSTSDVERAWEIDNQLVGYVACCGVEEVMLVQIHAEKGRKGEAGKVTVTRGVVRIQPDILTEWKAEMEAERSSLMRAWVIGVWAKNTASCRNWGRMCEFSGLCRAGASRAWMMQGMVKRDAIPNVIERSDDAASNSKE